MDMDTVLLQTFLLIVSMSLGRLHCKRSDLQLYSIVLPFSLEFRSYDIYILTDYVVLFDYECRVGCGDTLVRSP